MARFSRRAASTVLGETVSPAIPATGHVHPSGRVTAPTLPPRNDIVAEAVARVRAGVVTTLA